MPSIDTNLDQSTRLLASGREDWTRAKAATDGLEEAIYTLRALHKMHLSTGRSLDAIDQQIADWEQRRADLAGERP